MLLKFSHSNPHSKYVQYISGGELWKAKWIIQSSDGKHDYTEVDLIPE